MHAIPNRLAAIATVLAAAAALAGLAVTGLYVDAPELGAAGTRHRSGDPVPCRARPGHRPLDARRGSSAGRLAVVAGLAVPRLQLRDLRVRGGDEPAHGGPHRHLRSVAVEPPAGRSRGRRRRRRRDRASQPARGGRAPDRCRRDVQPPLARADRDRDHDGRPAAGPRQGRHLQQPRLRPRPRVLPATLRARRDRPAAAEQCRRLRLPDAHLGRPHGRRRRWRLPPDGSSRRSIAVPVVVAIGGLSVASSILAAAALVRPALSHRARPDLPSPAHLEG